MKKMYFFLIFIIIFMLLGSLSFFWYFKVYRHHDPLMENNIYATFKDDVNTISLKNQFFETSMLARESSKDLLFFNIKGKNNEESAINYQIILKSNINIEEESCLDIHKIRFDLIRKEKENDLYLVRNKSFEKLDNIVLYSDYLNKEDGILDSEYAIRIWYLDDLSTNNENNLEKCIENIHFTVTVEGNKDEEKYQVNYMNNFPKFVEENKKKIIEVYFNDISNENMEMYENAQFKEKLSYEQKGEVKFWLSNIESEDEKYILHVASKGLTYLLNGEGLFRDWENVTKIEFNNVNTSKINDMREMFYNNIHLENLDLSSFNTTNVTNMYQMFMQCKALPSLNLSSFSTSNVTNMASMFYGMNAIKELDLSMFDVLNTVTLSSIFQNNINLERINFDGWETKNLVNTNAMFYGAQKLKELDLTGFATNKLTDIRNMFRNCKELEKIYVSNQWDTSHITIDNNDLMFQNDWKLIGGNGTKCDEEHMNASFAQIDNLNSLPGLFTLK